MGEHGSYTREFIRARRQGAGLTQRQLADRAGVSVGVVRDLEQGRTTHLRAESARRLARELSLGARGNDGIAAGAGSPGPMGMLRIGVLGPLAARRSGVPVMLGPPMQRAVLGLLALHHGTGLSRLAIIDALWRDDPPVTAVPMVHSYISRLRRLLGPVCLLTAGNGYRLRPAACDLDLVTFEELVRCAGDARAAGELAVACQAYAEALALWRGDPLADAEVLRDHPAIARLSQQRADAVTGYAESASAAGWPDRALAQLRELAAREPLNERAHAWLMIALAGSGQQAAALAAYDQMRRRLDDQLGVRPGAELAQAHAQLLSQQIPASRAPHSSGWPGRAAASREVPRQLPGAVANFTGRAAELAALDGLLDRTGQEAPDTVVISAISGTAGVGKTALAVRWAHRVADWFPDGQLYLDLRGYDAREPVTAAEALTGFLRAFGIRGQDVPPTDEERAAAFRTVLAGRSVLLLLDNAASSEQVRPLLPANPACMTIVTSRDSLAGLVARHGARRVQLEVLSPGESAELLRALVGERVDAEPAAAARLTAQCCGLPLALRITAELAASRSGSTLADLAVELADEQSRLDLLDAGADPGTSVRAVFSWSYQHLSPEAARVFRLIALHPGSDIDGYCAAALTRLTVGRSRQMLNRLARAHLLQPAPAGRYLLHDLVRAYARELAAVQDSAGERDTAVACLVGYYLGAASAAMDALHPAERHRRPIITMSEHCMPPVRGNPSAARVWLDQERVTLVAITRMALDHGLYSQVTSLSAILFRYLDAGGYYQEAAVIHERACQAAVRSSDPAAEADALISLGLAETWQGRYQEASGHLDSALLLCERIGQLGGQARALHNLGLGSIQRGHYEDAASYLARALALYQRQGDRTGEVRALHNLAIIDARQGRYQQAIGHYRQALALSRLIGDRNGEAHLLAGIADIHHRRGHYDQAAADLDQALALHRQTGDRQGEARALADRCQVALKQGSDARAAGLGRQAVRLSQDIGDRSGLAGSLNALGNSLLAMNQPDDACAEYRAALHAATAVGDTLEQARAHNGLARACHAADDRGQARHHWRQALILYTELGAPEADQVRAELTGADNPRHKPRSP